MRKITVLVGVFLLLGLTASGVKAAIQWEPERVVTPVTKSYLSLHISGQTHFGMQRVIERDGQDVLFLSGVIPASSVFAVLDGPGFIGSLRFTIIDKKSGISFSETTVLSAIKDIEYWRDNPPTPRDNGSFTYANTTLRWIVFSHRTAGGKPYECMAFTSAGSGGKFGLRGEWCLENGRHFFEADVRGFVNAVGYKDVLIPTPLAQPPGR